MLGDHNSGEQLGVEEDLRRMLSSFLDQNSKRIWVLPTQFAAIHDLIGLLSMGFEDIIQGKEHPASHYSDVVRKWFSHLSEEKRPCPLAFSSLQMHMSEMIQTKLQYQHDYSGIYIGLTANHMVIFSGVVGTPLLALDTDVTSLCCKLVMNPELQGCNMAELRIHAFYNYQVIEKEFGLLEDYQVCAMSYQHKENLVRAPKISFERISL